MKTGLIVTAHVEGKAHINLDESAFDEIICADGGWNAARDLRLHPTFYIGDYDSSSRPDVDHLVVLPCRKNMTDTEAALDLAYEKGCRSITILGGLGGRFDHTMGNIGDLAFWSGKLEHAEILDGWNRVIIREPGTVKIGRNGFKYLSIIAYGGEVTGLTLKNVEYPLDNFTLTNETARCVSNEICENRSEAIISHRTGRILIIQSNDAD